MNKSSKMLPNQVETAESDRFQTKGRKDEIMHLSKKIKENREGIHNLNEAMKDELKDIQKKMNDKKDSKLMKAIFWFGCLVFAIIAGFWIYEVVITFRKEPLMSTTRFMKNKTFTWPTISIIPRYKCYNMTALEKLRKKHNVTLTTSELVPFKITDTNFNWSANNVSEIYLQSKYSPPLVNYTTRCVYRSSARKEANCLRDKKLGTWQTYNTQYSVNQAFTPAAAYSIYDYIVVFINASFCSGFTVALHPSTDKYYDVHPSSLTYGTKPGYSLRVSVAVEEYNRLSTRSSPCIDDPNYSEAECYDTKLIEYKIQRAGCYFTGITGYRKPGGGYPQCNNASAFNEFMFWHKELNFDQMKYDDLQKNKNECGEPCHTKKYIITDKYVNRYSNKRSAPIRFIFRLDPRAMRYQSLNEQRAMTLDILVANVGGIMGLFLGISCLTAINILQYVIRKITKFYE